MNLANRGSSKCFISRFRFGFRSTTRCTEYVSWVAINLFFLFKNVLGLTIGFEKSISFHHFTFKVKFVILIYRFLSSRGWHQCWFVWGKSIFRIGACLSLSHHRSTYRILRIGSIKWAITSFIFTQLAHSRVRELWWASWLRLVG